jgi:DNA topoisomerase-1
MAALDGKSYTRPPVLPADCAKAARLRHVGDALPGIRRRRSGTAFRYVRGDGAAVRDEATLARIRKLAIPPAWTEVWICADEQGHLQATGRDARGRKQYRYHARWREVRDESKYARLVAFGRALPRIRRRVARDLARPGLRREKVLATIVRLLKSGVQHAVALSDRRVASIVRRMQELPGGELFQYVDEDGATRSVESADVNAYLRSSAGEEFTSKDFRTWAGTLLCARALRSLEPPRSAASGKRAVAQAVESVSRELRNTPAVCRKCYIHPGVIDCYLAGRLREAMAGRSEEPALVALLRDEQRRAACCAIPSYAALGNVRCSRRLVMRKTGMGLASGPSAVRPSINHRSTT